MSKDELFALVARQRHALLDQLAPLSEQQWNEASLCVGWRVRDVLGHLVSLQDLPTRRFVLGKPGIRAFHQRIDRFAREFGERDPAALVARYRELASGRVAPPLVGPIAPLCDIAVHALDVERPLGLPFVVDDDATRRALDALCSGLVAFTSRRSVRGVRFEATDLDWHLGDGPLVRGRAGDILLAVMGRRHDSIELDGDGAARFADG